MIDFGPTQQVELLENLLWQYSPSHEEQSAVERLTAAMDGLGFQSSIDRVGNAVGVLGSGERELVLVGHIDTVPGRIPIRREGDRLWGRGAVDAKGPLACFVSGVALAGAVPGWRITVIGAVGEESDARGARFLTGRPAPYAAIIGEPSGWEQITLGYKGSAWVDFTYRRSITHGAARDENACQSAVQYWNRIVESCQTQNTGKTKVFEQLTPYLRAINSHSDGFFESAELRLNFRLPPGVSYESLHHLLTDAICCDENASFHLHDFDLAFRGEKNSPLVRAFLPAIRKQGGQPAFVFKSGTADMNVVGPAWQCPILAYGPGNSSLDHTPEEHILISEYLKGIQVLKEAVLHITRLG